MLLAVLLGIGVAYAFWFREASQRQRTCVVGALLAAFLLFVSPFCALTSALFSARVVHHVLIGLLLAPLVVAALPERRRMIGSPAVWTAVQALIFWLWHAPPVYAWALSSNAAYWLMQLSLLASAACFWASLRRVSAPVAVAALLATMVQMGLLGALITFSAAPLYAPHFLATQVWGFSPLEDQQMAGLIMWAPGAAAYLIAAMVLAGRWLGREARLSAAP